LTVAVADGNTVVVPMSRPGPTTAVGAWLVAAVAEFNSAPKMTEYLANMAGGYFDKLRLLHGSRGGTIVFRVLERANE